MCASRSHDTYLIEAQDRLGGLLCSDRIADGYFDYGCHIAAETGIGDLDEILFQSFSDTNCNKYNTCLAGSYFSGCLTETSPHIDIRNLPDEIYQKATFDILHARDTGAMNLRDYCINRFGETLYHCAFLPIIKKFLGMDPKHLDKNCLSLFDMKRVVAYNERTATLLKADPYFDDLLGYHNPSQGSLKYYPKNGGIGSWARALERQLAEAGVKILKNTKPVSITFDNDKYPVRLSLKNNILEAEQLVWALPAPLLLLQINDREIDLHRPEFRSAHLFDFAFDQALESSCQYINIHEPQMLSGRITLYHNLNPGTPYHSCTVEVIGDVFSGHENAMEIILKELHTIGLVQNRTNCILKNYRCWNSGFPVMTNEYVSRLEETERYIQEKYTATTLIGRGNSGAFFMSDVLRKTYENIDRKF